MQWNSSKVQLVADWVTNTDQDSNSFQVEPQHQLSVFRSPNTNFQTQVPTCKVCLRLTRSPKSLQHMNLVQQYDGRRLLPMKLKLRPLHVYNEEQTTDRASSQSFRLNCTWWLWNRQQIWVHSFYDPEQQTPTWSHSRSLQPWNVGRGCWGSHQTRCHSLTSSRQFKWWLIMTHSRIGFTFSIHCS